MSSAKTFGILAILLALAGFGAWWYVTSRPKPSSTLNIQKVDNPLIGSSPDPSKLFYKVTIPKGGWYDTGLWVRPWKYVNAMSTGQPCELKIGDTTNNARLMTSGIFNAVIVTTENSSGSHIGNYKGENIYQEIAPVGDQGKIYLKLSDEAATDQIEVTMQIEPIPSDQLHTYQDKTVQSWSSQHKGALISVVLAGIVSFLFGLIIGRVSARW